MAAEDQKQIQDLVADMPFRTPVISEEQAQQLPSEQIEREWLAVTEAARRGIINDEATRAAATELITRPVSEQLPLEAMSALSEQNRRVGRIARKATQLASLLETPAVPDQYLVPDITNAPALQTSEFTKWQLETSRRYSDDPDAAAAKRAAEIRADVERSPGVSDAERQLVARRYRFARDIKELALMAELHDEPIDEQAAQSVDGLVTHTLKSGTKLVLSEEAHQMTPALLNPARWESRRQLKDRVYAVRIDGQDYILKEKKTPRHTDTKKHGHVEGLTSEQEFKTAQHFANLGTLEKGDVRLRWEKPLGYVEFPDGYSFCLFERETGLIASGASLHLQGEIEHAAPAYSQEFEEIGRQAKQLIADREDLFPSEPRRRQSGLTRVFEWLSQPFRRKAGSSRSEELAFDDFAALKAAYTEDEARDFLGETMRQAGYSNSDLDGYSFKIIPGERPKLEIVGFDFEYYQYDPQNAERIARNVTENRRTASSIYLRYSPYDGYHRSENRRRFSEAASYVMLQQRGFRLPPRRTTTQE